MTEYKRRLPPRGIFWIVEVYTVSTNEKSSLPAVVLVANRDEPEPNMAEPPLGLEDVYLYIS